ncbi:RrF2 family transcriptional regulator [Zwartia vadi]|uniref:RrF2 family transcriptional regulator n=1 Tax=Zwartia vadi TaxID=3058168 RepID=UPI0025B3655D|nr:Rrf2 family transcriptional regulator [Zwartia vadi]MDN3988576.1 Rrf2 family transcriptional regulator [Zwartia vadi]
MSANESKHALSLVVLLAGLPNGEALTTQDLARHLDLSVSYVENLLKGLRTRQLLKSNRGPRGGHRFDGDLTGLSVWDVVSIFGGSDLPPAEPSENGHVTAWLEAEYEHIKNEFLKSVPLVKLLGRPGEIDFLLDLELAAEDFKPVLDTLALQALGQENDYADTERNLKNHRDGVGRSYAL